MTNKWTFPAMGVGSLLIASMVMAARPNKPILGAVGIDNGSHGNYRITLGYSAAPTGPRPDLYEIYMMRAGEPWPGQKVHQGNDGFRASFLLPASEIDRGKKYSFFVRAVGDPPSDYSDSATEWAYSPCSPFDESSTSFGPDRPQIVGHDKICRERSDKKRECQALLSIRHASRTVSDVSETIVYEYPAGERPRWYPGGGQSTGRVDQWRGPTVLYDQTRCYVVKSAAPSPRGGRLTTKPVYGLSAPSNEVCITFDSLEQPAPPTRRHTHPHPCDR